MTGGISTGLASLLLALATATPAGAQDSLPASGKTALDGDYLIVGAGPGIGPSYEGSDDYVAFPAAAIQGKIGGVSINPRPAGIALDLYNDPKGAKLGFQIGPVVRARFDRHSQIKDAVVAALGKRDIAVELGGNAGISINRIANGYDSLTFSTDVRWDVAGAHDGMVIVPTITYQTPLSKGVYIGLSLFGEHDDNKYADYYYSVSATGSTASGLPVYTAHSGWKNAGAGMLAAIDLDGDLTNGGFALYAGAAYTRMLGNFRRAPVVALRGSPDQFVGALGIGYTF